jgi:hypothetical protein
MEERNKMLVSNACTNIEGTHKQTNTDAGDSSVKNVVTAVHRVMHTATVIICGET